MDQRPQPPIPALNAIAGDQTADAAVAVGKWMDVDQSMMRRRNGKDPQAGLLLGRRKPPLKMP
jgi:hypothetical protein